MCRSVNRLQTKVLIYLWFEELCTSQSKVKGGKPHIHQHRSNKILIPTTSLQRITHVRLFAFHKWTDHTSISWGSHDGHQPGSARWSKRPWRLLSGISSQSRSNNHTNHQNKWSCHLPCVNKIQDMWMKTSERKRLIIHLFTSGQRQVNVSSVFMLICTIPTFLCLCHIGEQADEIIMKLLSKAIETSPCLSSRFSQSKITYKAVS